MEFGKELTKPNIMRRACNPIGFKLHVLELLKLAILNVLHSQREGPMRNAKEEDVFDALKKMIEKLPLSVPNAN